MEERDTEVIDVKVDQAGGRGPVRLFELKEIETSCVRVDQG